MRDERRDVGRGRDRQHDLYVRPSGQRDEQLFERSARLDVQSDERAFDDQYARRGQQHFGDLEFSQLAARQQDDLFLQHAADAEQVEDPFAFQRVAGHVVKHFRGQRRAFAVGGVPPLLVIVFSVGAAVSVAECDVADVLRRTVVVRAEIVVQLAFREVKVAQQRFD